MNPAIVVSVLVGLVALSTALGLLWRTRTGRVRSNASGDLVDLVEVPLGSRATLLQFSTEVCAPCVPTRRVLGVIAGEHDSVQHIDIDVTNRPDLAARFNILQTPTTFILDHSGAIRARIGGAPRPTDLRAELDRILAA